MDWNARTLLAVLATGRLPRDVVSPDEFEDPVLRSLCEALLSGQSPAGLMEQQVDEAGRGAVGDILSINTALDDEGLMKMARDCVKKMRIERLERELDLIQKSLPDLPEEQQSQETQRAILINKQLMELK